MGIKIIATGRYLPRNIVTNDDFTGIVDTSDEWISQRTGMKERHIASGEPTWLMGELAARDALESGGIDPLSIDLILVTSVTPDYMTPSAACIIQGRIGAANAACIDLNAACAGFVYALDMARRYLCFDDVRRVLIVSAEELSKITDYTDRASCVLFGDAAGAVVVEAADTPFASVIGADGTGAPLLYAKSPAVNENPFRKPELAPEYEEIIHAKNHFLYMDGREVYKFAVKIMPHAVQEACDKLGVPVEAIDLLVPHQANVRIVDTAVKTLGLPPERVYVNLAKHGNVSSACIPLCLDEINKGGLIQPGRRIALVGFGAGLTYASAIFTW
ncbi:ketoacyl-ACP synthase III [Clostridiaceae bacterium NSJ-31]|uniref:Beta-ketoacyl-[acyl-carrier-protein] synthase III n=1 Tax=Ligaoa zhengdingensis TaxID=2763658 RepID=A0A926DVN1_9FIRM|nr:beta-ketoacyl-ACP synthase III [Ligaoa zhengdingensis]MBC8546203.1 ketoacyl-ACP synthase III [Ligaoa zhengdingensis]